MLLILATSSNAALQTRPPGLDPAGMRIAAMESAIEQAWQAIADNRLTKGQPNARDLLHKVLQLDPFNPQARSAMANLAGALIAHGRQALEQEPPNPDTAQRYWGYARDLAIAYRLPEVTESLDALLIGIHSHQLSDAKRPLEQRSEQLALELEQAKSQRQELEQQLAQRRQLQPAKPQPVLASNPAPSTPVSSGAPIQLRANPIDLSETAAKKMLSDYGFFDSGWNQQGRFKGELADNGDGTLSDRKTELIWQQGGSDRTMTWAEAKSWIKELNQREGRTGKERWRLPTLEEAASLLRHEQNDANLYIDGLFDPKQSYIWTADAKGSSAAWRVHFYFGNVYKFDTGYGGWVRACRSSG
jgi:hypothetical protein